MFISPESEPSPQIPHLAASCDDNPSVQRAGEISSLLPAAPSRFPAGPQCPRPPNTEVPWPGLSVLEEAPLFSDSWHWFSPHQDCVDPARKSYLLFASSSSTHPFQRRLPSGPTLVALVLHRVPACITLEPELSMSFRNDATERFIITLTATFLNTFSNMRRNSSACHASTPAG